MNTAIPPDPDQSLPPPAIGTRIGGYVVTGAYPAGTTPPDLGIDIWDDEQFYAWPKPDPTSQTILKIPVAMPLPAPRRVVPRTAPQRREPHRAARAGAAPTDTEDPDPDPADPGPGLRAWASLLPRLAAEYSVIREHRPLAIGIREALHQAMPGVSRTLIGGALALHPHSDRYLDAIAAGGPRYAGIQ